MISIRSNSIKNLQLAKFSKILLFSQFSHLCFANMVVSKADHDCRQQNNICLHIIRIVDGRGRLPQYWLAWNEVPVIRKVASRAF